MYYTVILAYPDYMQSQHGEIYAEAVETTGPAAAAAEIVKLHAIENNDMDDDQSNDFLCLAVIEGNHNIAYSEAPNF